MASTRLASRGVVGFDGRVRRCLLAAADCGDESIVAVGVERRHGSSGRTRERRVISRLIRYGSIRPDWRRRF
jgi:hypothetical protein